MRQELYKNPLEQFNYRALLYIGLILSQTQSLLNIPFIAPTYYSPTFTTLLFISSTIFLTFLILGYAFFNLRNLAFLLEIYQFIFLPVMVLLLGLLIQGDAVIGVISFCSLLLAFQGILLILKVVYFGSVTEQLSQISMLNKLVRIIKLLIIGILPSLVTSKIVMVVIVGFCQIVSLIFFFFKFTYQKLIYQYLLLVGVFFGVISALQNTIQTIFQYQYFFVGQVFSLYFYFFQQNFLASLLELKYISHLEFTSEAKHDDQFLAALLFIQESFFTKKRTIHLSEQARNQAASHAAILIQRSKNHLSKIQSIDQTNILKQIEQGGRQIAIKMFRVAEDKFKGKNSFHGFQFLINSTIQLGDQFKNHALVLYYSGVEHKKSKNSLQISKYQYLYQKVIRKLQKTDNDPSQIRFIKFSDCLQQLSRQIENCLNCQIKLVQYLGDDDKKGQLFPQDRLKERNKNKLKIRKIIQRATTDSLYIYSNEFKYLFILYTVCMEKRIEGLKGQIRHLFLSAQNDNNLTSQQIGSLVVLSGFNVGEIVNSNETFKNSFGVTLNSFSRNNISQFLPSDKQRQTHFNLMTQIHQGIKLKFNDHRQYDCWLFIQKQGRNMNLKSLQKFTITSRLYYQHKESFNYVCSLSAKINYDNFRVLRKQCDLYQTKGLQFQVTETFNVSQLGEDFQIFQIQFLQQDIANMIQSQRKPQLANKKKIEGYLEQKINLVERKLADQNINNKKQFSINNKIQIILIIGVIYLLAMSFIGIRQQVSNIAFLIGQAKPNIRKVELIRNQVFLDQQIVDYVKKTNYFKEDICSSTAINNITDFVTKKLFLNVVDNTDKFFKLTYNQNSPPQFSNILTNIFSPAPYLTSKNAVNFHKFLHMLKSQTYDWKGKLQDSSITLDTNYYNKLPIMLSNWTIDSDDSLYTLIVKSQNSLINELNTSITITRVISFIILIILAIFLAFFRLKDNMSLVRYYKTLQSVGNNIISTRLKQIKYTLTQLHRLKANRISGIQFDSDFTVQIRGDKKQPQRIPLDAFTQLRNDQFDKSSEQLSMQQTDIDQRKKLLKYQQKQSMHLPQSITIRSIFYSRIYLLFLSIFITGLFLGVIYVLQTQNSTKNLYINCDLVSQQLAIIQQKFINLISYDWTKVLSLQMSSISTIQAAKMFNQSITTMSQTKLQNKIEKAYKKQISDQILFGNVCQFANDVNACNLYRNGIFLSGFSMLLPFSIKQSIQTDQISNNYTQYIPNLCDKTWLLYQIVIPMTYNISDYGLASMKNTNNNILLGLYLEVILGMIGLLLMTLCCQLKRQNSQKVIRQQVLSLQTVGVLYRINEFKPYFNKVYYS